MHGITFVNVAFLAALAVTAAALVYDRIGEELDAGAAELVRRAALDTAARVEAALGAARADALVLSESSGDGRQGRVWSDGFFALHPEFAALLPSSGTPLINKAFFAGRGLDENAPARYLEAEQELVLRADAAVTRDGILAGNASPHFGVPVLALFFKDRRGSVAVAFFSSAAFLALLDGGPERVYVVNGRDDVLLDTDPDPVAGGENFWQRPLVRLMRSTDAPGMDGVFEAEGRGVYTGAFRRLRTAGADAAALAELSRDSTRAGLRRAMRSGLRLCVAALGLVALFSFALSFSTRRYLYNIFLRQEKEIACGLRLKNIFRSLPESRLADTDALGKVPLNGENRVVTVVFAGLRGNEAIRGLSPQRMLRMLNGAISLALDSFAKTGGVVDRLAGDGLTGVWGAPFSNGGPERDALDAVRGALLLRAALVKRGGAAGGAAAAGRQVTLSCGINSGPVLAGPLGGEGRSAYTFTGGAVRRAAFLESLNRRFGTDILLGESTMALVGKYFITEELPPVKAGGAGKPIRIFAVINIKVTKKGTEQPKPVNMTELRELLNAAGLPGKAGLAVSQKSPPRVGRDGDWRA
ncbi:MAG: adenylate/guanylate cyclase domain-containing protein [Spirochaetaceae bacterium]|nr:adenylate/guanylate cyclase domain-containing protein [Spirochaetaceae bacterium]